LRASSAVGVERALRRKRNVAARAEAAPFGMIDNDGSDLRVARAMRAAPLVIARTISSVSAWIALGRLRRDAPGGGSFALSDKHVSRHWRSKSRPMIIA
jgi:hypothetical protein